MLQNVNGPEERGSTAHDVRWTIFSIKWNDSSTKLWLCAVLNWSTNTAIGDSGHSPSQWVLGRSLRLPFQLLSRASQSAPHQRLRDDFAYQRRVAMLAEAEIDPQHLVQQGNQSCLPVPCPKCQYRSVTSSFCSRRRGHVLARKQQVKESVVNAFVGWVQELSLGMKVVQKCGLVIAMPFSRQLETTFDSRKWRSNFPWHDLYDSLRDTDEQTYFDLSPPSVSRDPQYGGPSTSNDVPMTPVLVSDESMLDATTDEPDTSEVRVLPNSVYAPGRNPRVRWRSDVLKNPTPQTALSPVVPLQNVPAATPSWSPLLPVTHETPSVQQPVTPHIDVQHEFPPPASSADGHPMPLPHDDDTPPWVYQEPETLWISTKQDTPVIVPQQVPLPPIQVSPSQEETNMSTGDSIIPLPPPPSIHEDVLPPAPSFDETPFETAQVPETPTIPSVGKRWRSVPETPTIPSVAKRWRSVGKRWRSGALQQVPENPTNPSVAKYWRSGTLYLENPVSKRWRSDTLHPSTLFRPQHLHSFGGAQVFCVPCVHFEDSKTNNQTRRNV